MHLNLDGSKLIEKDYCFSASNYDSRKHYSIETTTLKKYLIIDNSLIDLKPTIYNILDL